MFVVIEKDDNLTLSKYCEANNLEEMARNYQEYHNTFSKTSEQTRDSSITNFRNQAARKEIIRMLAIGKDDIYFI
jgi:hypothetical protein